MAISIEALAKKYYEKWRRTKDSATPSGWSLDTLKTLVAADRLDKTAYERIVGEPYEEGE